MIKEEIIKTIESAVKNLQKQKLFPSFKLQEIPIEYPREKAYGDYSTNVSLQLVKLVKKSPMEIAEMLSKEIKKIDKCLFEKIEVVKPGFINFFISSEYLQGLLIEVLEQKDRFGSLKLGKGAKINVEFISANPTGPLTLGNGRGGFCGDVLVNVLEKAGYKVTREYYINDRGTQIVKLGHSVLKDSEAMYKGDYVDELAKKIKGKDASIVGDKAAQYILDKMIKPTIKRMNIKFDVWFSEKSLYKDKSVDKTIKDLTKNGFTYESEGAIWFKCKELEDDKDRVLVREDGEETYFASDIAYMKNKFSRGFEKLFFFLGADHYGYVPRLKAAVEVLGYKKEQIEAIVMQLVHLFKNGQEVKMSKRAGVYVTLDELLDEINLDVARFFFLQRGSNTHLNFDLNLAKEQSSKNPVYYIQYAHARICSIIKKAGALKKGDVGLLKEKEELDLIKQIIKLPEIIEETAKDYQVQRLTQYATEIADAFHYFYEKCRVIGEDKKITGARTSLILATKIVLKNTLSLMGISAPEKM